MSPAEVAWRARDEALQLLWAPRQVRREQLAASVSLPSGERRFTAVLRPDTSARVPEEARKAVLDAAGRLLSGEWDVLGVTRTDLVRPDWFHDPVTGGRSAPDRYALGIDPRLEEEAGTVRQVWELSRLQHLTLLATAWFLAREQPYAHRVAEQLRSWWRENPFLSGVNWTNGAEIGIRLISLAWIRRLLADWSEVADLFEGNALAVHQIRWHQQYLAAFPGRGSAADHLVIAEAAGQLVASCAFPWFPESEHWRRKSALLLERELARHTFPSGIGREMGADCQCFIAELGLVAGAEAGASGHPLSGGTWQRLSAMVDSAAALVDGQLRPPRPGDSGEGRALLLDAPVPNRWPSLLALGEALLGRLDWWPPVTADASSSVIGALAPAQPDIAGRPSRRPSSFPDAGVTLLRTAAEDTPEIWCRCDGGPGGYISIAPHAHADDLSVAVRYGGVDIFAGPGTYWYQGKSTGSASAGSVIADDSSEFSGWSQPGEGSPFLRLRHAPPREVEVVDDGDIASWTAEHDSDASLDPPAPHRRSVLLDRASRSIDIIDEIGGGSRDIRLAFHLGPDVQAELDESCAALNWPTAAAPGAARLELPAGLRWSLHRGETGHVAGRAPGRRVPALTLLGRGRCLPEVPLITRLEFVGTGQSAKSAVAAMAISWTSFIAFPDRAPEIRMEAR